MAVFLGRFLSVIQYLQGLGSKSRTALARRMYCNFSSHRDRPAATEGNVIQLFARPWQEAKENLSKEAATFVYEFEFSTESE